MSAPTERDGALAGVVGRVLLALYPPRFRREEGPAIVRDLRARGAERRAAAGNTAYAVWLARAAASLVGNAFAEWVRPSAGAPSGVIQDARLALRGLRRSPGLTAVVLVTLALGIGGSASVFSVVSALLIEPLPYPRADELVRLHQVDQRDPGAELVVTGPHFLEYRARARSFAAVAGLYTFDEVGADLMVGGTPQRIRLLQVSPDYFRVLEAEPTSGRVLAAGEENGERVAVLSESLWRRLGSPPAGSGATVELDGATYGLVGVVPSDLRDPLVGAVDAWIPLTLHPDGGLDTGNHFLSVIARLAPGVGVEAARQEMAALDAALAEQWPDAAVDTGFRLVPLDEDVTGEARGTVAILLGAVLMVLLIACTNVAGLLTVRSLGRRHELAVRTALGAGAGRITRELLVESLILAGLGGLLGLILAGVSLDALVALGRDALPPTTTVTIDGRVMAFAAGLSLLTGLAFGVAPALQARAASPAGTLRRSASRGVTGAEGRVRTALVAGQLALACVLLVGFATLASTVRRLATLDLGVRSEGVQTFQLNLPASRYDPAARVALHERLVGRLVAIPGVAAVGATHWLPAVRWSYSWGTAAASGPLAGTREGFMPAEQRVVAGDFFDVLGVPLVEGRVFDSRDAPDAPPVAVISRLTAERLFPGTSAVGQTIRAGGGERLVIGVVEDVARDAYGERSAHVYHAYAQFAERNWALTYVVAGTTAAAPAVADLRRAVAELDPQLVVHNPATLATVLGRGVGRERFAFVLGAAFAVLALGLAGLGLYGVLAHAVSRRTREIGIRQALGAGRREVAALVLRGAALVTALGMALGLIGSRTLERVLGSLLFRAEPGDPAVLATAVLTLAVVAALATAVPLLRAVSVPPRRALAE